MTTLFQTDLVLEDPRVLLRPIQTSDYDGLAQVAFAPGIWRYFTSRVETEAHLREFIAEAVDSNAAGRTMALTIVDKATGGLAGSMRFANWSPRDDRVEIGWSWLGEPFQGTGVNPRTKYLMMRHAFEHGIQRLEFKTDVLNTVARRALLAIGASEDGVLRSHTLMPGNRRRDTIYYSVLASEWPAVRQRLAQRIGDALGEATSAPAAL